MLQARHMIPVRTVKGECVYEARVINSRKTGQHEQTVSLLGKLRIKKSLSQLQQFSRNCTKFLLVVFLLTIKQFSKTSCHFVAHLSMWLHNKPVC